MLRNRQDLFTYKGVTQMPACLYQEVDGWMLIRHDLPKNSSQQPGLGQMVKLVLKDGTEKVGTFDQLGEVDAKQVVGVWVKSDTTVS